MNGVQIAAAFVGIVAAALWFAAAVVSLSPNISGTMGGVEDWDELRRFLKRQGRLNAAAAATTAVTIVLQVVAAFVR